MANNMKSPVGRTVCSVQYGKGTDKNKESGSGLAFAVVVREGEIDCGNPILFGGPYTN